MEYIFYSLIGRHGNKSPNEIIKDKQDEIKACKFSLWSAQIDKKSIEQVWNLDKSDRVIVLCRVSNKAKDPVDKENMYTAITMAGPEGEKSIPEGIMTTFTKGKNYQAYVVKKYEILDSPIIFDFGKYNTLLSDNTTKSFKERFRNTRFQNTFGRKDVQLKESCTKEIQVLMELEYPFVVNIK